MRSVKEEIKNNLEQIVQEMAGEGISVSIEQPKEAGHGDYSSNIAMAIFSSSKFKVQSSKFRTPFELAEEIVKRFMIHDSRFKIDIVKPGFINFWVPQDYLISQLDYLLSLDEKVAIATIMENKKIIVEYTDPNPFKEFHIGHLFSNIIGESLSRIFAANAATVWRVDYFGDVGMHVAKAIWGILQKFKIQNSKFKVDEKLRELEKQPLKERIKFLGEGYALGSNAYADNEAAKEEIKHLNKLIYLAAQKMWQEEKGITPLVDYKQGDIVDEKEFQEVYILYTTGRKWSLENFEIIYARLGTKFDEYYPESIAGGRGYKLVIDNLAKGIFRKSEGAVIFPGEEHGLTHNRVFINSLGLPTYEAKELGLAPWKYENFPYDLSFIVTGTEIQAYFTVLLAALKKVNPGLGEKTIPVLHGMVRLPQGKMSSRLGNVITGEWLVSEAKARIQDAYKDMDKDSAEKVAVGAVKYALLKGGVGRDITFDFNESISLEGNSGPYLQYTYARTRSVLAKVKSQKSKVKTAIQNSKFKEELDARRYTLNAEEISLLRLLLHYPEVVEQACLHRAPHLICTYLFDLAQAFNLFYQKHPILTSSSKKFRLLLTASVGKVLYHGLYLLGIKTPERM